jgi:hypothetical protein
MMKAELKSQAIDSPLLAEREKVNPVQTSCPTRDLSSLITAHDHVFDAWSTVQTNNEDASTSAHEKDHSVASVIYP